MFEVMIDERLETSQQLVIDKGKIPIPVEDNLNSGKLNFGAGSDYLVTYYE
jgi:hypothetical protein